ncbi:hypothetical protein [Acetobacterium bakii]|uniref:Uncharacterized protein n=1 Tax=Acetobacterium bakii TaxID=52689 RepID=A0A0L6TWF0_9FIRM|nr:hypothetical protein [Acetobacterium bakii]KNZ40604.1 hypothetical protein AKG39_16800 [Acetobacterium bakii]
MLKNKKTNIGKFLYFDWLIPIVDYFRIVKFNEVIFDIVVPAIIAIIVTLIYYPTALIQNAIISLNEILPNVLAILIGFSISAIAIIISSDKKKYEKSVKEKFIGSDPLTIYRYLLIIMIFTLLQEIIALLLVFFVCFFRAVWGNIITDCIFLGLYIFLILNIFAVLTRSIVYLYASNYRNN